MRNLRKGIALLFLGFVSLVSCDTDNGEVNPVVVTAPATYSFERAGESTVSYSGQADRIAMATELAASMLDFNNATSESLLAMYRNEGASGEDVSPYTSADLNGSTKSIKSKVASSADFFSANTVEGTAFKNLFESFINTQITEVFPSSETLASLGQAGQVADGSSTRYVTSKGLEQNQLLAKGLIGALMLDQINNNYLSTAVLDEAENRTNNDTQVLEEGKIYTTMEHKWDEAFGYLFGGAADGENAIATLGTDDNFLNKYLGRVNDDSDFAGIGQTVFDAFKLGRAAIVAHEYDLRDKQIAIIRENLSKVIAIRAVHYLQSGKAALQSEDFGGAFHDLSEGFGFVYSLRFTRIPTSNEPYISGDEINTFLAQTIETENGLWDVNTDLLDQFSDKVASAFGFEVASTVN